MVDYIGACPICHGNRAAYPQAPSGQQAEPTEAMFAHIRAIDNTMDREDMRQIIEGILALAGHQSERPAPAGQAVGDLLTALRTARQHVANNTGSASPQWLRTQATFDLQLIDAALAASQAERPAVKEGS